MKPVLASLLVLAVAGCGNLVSKEDLKPHPKSASTEFGAAAPSGLVLVPTSVPEDAYLDGVTTYTGLDVVAPASAQSKGLRYGLAGASWSVSVCTARPAHFAEMCFRSAERKDGQAAAGDPQPVTGVVGGVQFAVWNGVRGEAPPAWSTVMTSSWQQRPWVPRLREGVVPPEVQKREG